MDTTSHTEAPAITRAPAATVRRIIARVLLGEPQTDVRVGNITLYPHQASAADRIHRALHECGGALLCDVVGLGKTFTALAVAASYDRVLIVAPATLRPMWLDALRETGVGADFVSVEALSRGATITPRYQLVLVDEAHHLRNPGTRRYAEVSRLCIFASVLLISATPLHNSRADVSALIALFLGERAYSLTLAALSRMIIRRVERSDEAGPVLPRVRHVPWRTVPLDEGTFARILALPPPLPPSDGGEAATLITHGLVRQWVSSDAALLGALRRREARAHALLAALDVGRYPTRSQLRDWLLADDALQLAFPELLPPSLAPPGKTIAPHDMRRAVACHASDVSSLARSVRAHSPTDIARRDLIRALVNLHHGEKIVLFTSYTETATWVYRSLHQEGHIAMLTSAGGRVAGGSIARAEVFSRFAPVASGSRPPRACDVINLLVTTDMLSEGVNLQDGSVVIHLDLPWTHARVEQRIGRLARIGSRHTVVTSYQLRPPGAVEAFLKGADIIERKDRAARAVLGRSSAGPGAGHHSGRSHVELAERIRSRLQRWLQDGSNGDSPRDWARAFRSPVVAAVASHTTGAIVAYTARGSPQLAAMDATLHVSTDLPDVDDALTQAECAELTVPDELVARVWTALALWQEGVRAAADAGVDGASAAMDSNRHRRSAIRRADAAVSTHPFSRRSEWASQLSMLRAAASTRIPIALERVVYAGSPDPSTAREGYDLLIQRGRAAPEAGSGFTVVAILLLVRSVGAALPTAG